ncbi:MAG: hypothetical protein DRR08_18970 [Candidatus Parabeggiatoa sp. nov. 2]|nr:MAG: hypothetical protein B6247_11930 [Beggiatoa sp. 4572_84]RKZ57453.1 MAG: hypothetical protein DRR08_18970 [Gammaproteobacteria bacterium]
MGFGITAPRCLNVKTCGFWHHSANPEGIVVQQCSIFLPSKTLVLLHKFLNNLFLWILNGRP